MSSSNLNEINSFAITTSAWDSTVISQLKSIPVEMLILNNSSNLNPYDFKKTNTTKKLIAYQYFGDYQIDYGTISPLTTQQNWDANRDGIPDESAPTWLAPVHLSWELPFDASSPYFQGKYPSYLVRYWEDSWLTEMKKVIDEKFSSGWDGIWLDVVGTKAWFSSTFLRTETYTQEEIADYTFYALNQLNNYISKNYSDFSLLINGSTINNWLLHKPEVLNVIDGIVFESSAFNITGDTSYPQTSNFVSFDNEFEEVKLVNSINSDLPIFTWESCENDHRIFIKYSNYVNQFGHNSYLNYDHLERLSANSNDRDMGYHFISYVGDQNANSFEADLDYRAFIVGRDGNDNLLGSKYNDFLNGGEGDDYLDGKENLDTAIYQKGFNQYSIDFSISEDNISTYIVNGEGEDVLINIERISFKDRTLDTQYFDKNTQYSLDYIKDYDGNLHANTGSVSDATKSAYKYQGKLDVNNDNFLDLVFTNKINGRWATGKIDSVTGLIDYSDHGAGGGTRVIGIYDDPLIAVGNANGGFLDDGVTPAPAQFGATGSDRYLVVNGETIDRLALNSQVRFQNDLYNDNLTLKTSGDYDGDGFQEVYWKTNDGDVYLRSLMHADGNIQYANYQNQTQMSDYLTGHGYQSVISDII